jgi:hypothetical protein
VLSVTPLKGELERRGLSTKVPFNVRAVYVQSASNGAKSPIGFRLNNVNGTNLDIEGGHDDDNHKWATYTADADEQTKYQTATDKGLLVHENELSDFARVNSTVSVKEMYKNVEKHPDYPEHAMITADFSGFTNPANTTHKEKSSSMHHLAQLVYSNAKTQINNHPEIVKNLPGVKLVPIKENDKNNKTFTDVDVKLDSISKTPGKFKIFVKEDELDKALKGYKQELQNNVRLTDAEKHTITVFRPGQAPVDSVDYPANSIGNISREANVTASDVDRAKKTWTSASLKVLYEVDHPGTKAGQE